MEAALLLQEFRSFGQVVGDSDVGGTRCAAPAAVAAAAAVPAAGETGAGAQPPAKRKRGRPLGSKSNLKPEDPAAWEPKKVSVTITGGSRDIDPSKLDDMEAFLSEYCLAGMDVSALDVTVGRLC